MAKVVIVGSGFFGMTTAFLIAEKIGIEVLVLEKRDHLGGNAYSYQDPTTGVEVHKYGSHIFHTNNESVWKFINQFTKFNDYEHRVYSHHRNTFFQMPLNLHSLSQFFEQPLTPDGAQQLLSDLQIGDLTEARSFEEAALATVGRDLYEAFFKGYTAKQWQTDPDALPREVFSRLPVRYNFDSRYFSDKYQGIPVGGYGLIFEEMASHPLIEVETEVDFFKRKNIPRSITIYTGALDRYFDYQHGELGWRTLDFEYEIIDKNDFQGTSVINYPNENVAYTRIHEFKHFATEDFDSRKTLIAKEFSRFATKTDEPYYPIRSIRDREKLTKYRSLAASENDVYFGGRLGSYQYLDMHMAIASAHSLFENHLLQRLA